MAGFVKIYSTILQSSVWFEDAPIRVLWITLLAMADRRGVVVASLPGLAHAANVTREQCEAGLLKLSAPDPDSKSKSREGRRIREIKGGWAILNYTKYRELRTEGQVVDAERKKRWRKAKTAAENVPECPTMSHTSSELKEVSCKSKNDNVPHGDMSRMSHTEADADKETTTTARAVPALPQYDQIFAEAWSVYPKRSNNSKGAAWRQWLARVGEGIDPLDMLEGARRYRKLCDAERADPQFIKHASTFFGRDRHFENDMTPVAHRGELEVRVAEIVGEEDAAIARTQELLARRLGAVA
jgi:hypothetical protein